jgi:hypothetical protein
MSSHVPESVTAKREVKSDGETIGDSSAVKRDDPKG